MNKTLLVALAIIGAIAAIVIVLAGGGDPVVGPRDRASDVSLGEGDDPPADAALADIAEASVTKTGGEIVFEVTMARPVPPPGSSDDLSFRWDLTESGEDSWMVTADLSAAPMATVRSLRSDYGASTIDDTLPGTISVSENTITVTLEASKVEGFPTSFGWKLTATLDGNRADPASAVVTDTAPDGGPGEVE